MTKEANTYSASGEVGSVRQRRTRWERIWLDLKKAPPTAIFGMIVIFGYALVSLFAPILAPFGEADTQFSAYQTFSSKHILGTDQIGRDILSRLIYGARNTIGIALITTIISFVIGMTLGLIAAINRSYLDQVISRGVDVLMAIPSLIFALMLLSIFGSSTFSLICIMAVLDSTRVFRLTRAVSMNVVVMDYVEAAALRGEKLGWIMRKEILPNILPPLVAEFGLRFCFVFLAIAAL
ncbi:MAG: ABC transporter permease, partial [Paracoccaceae bacterium]